VVRGATARRSTKYGGDHVMEPVRYYECRMGRLSKEEIIALINAKKQDKKYGWELDCLELGRQLERLKKAEEDND